jgi:hypothetical protein
MDGDEQKYPAGHGASADEPDAQYEPVLHDPLPMAADEPAGQ